MDLVNGLPSFGGGAVSSENNGVGWEGGCVCGCVQGGGCPTQGGGGTFGIGGAPGGGGGGGPGGNPNNYNKY